MARRRMIESNIAYDKELNALSDSAQLLYLKALPHADDYGRVEGDPEILKAKIEPLRDIPKEKYPKLIREIAEAGLWLWYRTTEGKQVLQYNPVAYDRINKFLIKSRGKSEFPGYMKAYEIICGHMEPYIDIREKKKEERKDKLLDTLAVIPPALKKLEGFVKAWMTFEQMRKEIGHPIKSQVSVERIFSKLEKMPDPVAAIEQSIEKEWRGIFPVKGNQRGTSYSFNSSKYPTARRKVEP